MQWVWIWPSSGNKDPIHHMAKKKKKKKQWPKKRIHTGNLRCDSEWAVGADRYWRSGAGTQRCHAWDEINCLVLDGSLGWVTNKGSISQSECWSERCFRRASIPQSNQFEKLSFLHFLPDDSQCMFWKFLALGHGYRCSWDPLDTWTVNSGVWKWPWKSSLLGSLSNPDFSDVALVASDQPKRE